MNFPEQLKAPFPFLSSPEIQALSRASFQIHRGAQGVSSKTYLAQKKQDLQQFLTGKTLIYLDTCHWINLRHVILNTRHEKPGYRDILGLMEKLSLQKKICCPFSFFLFLEIMKQNDLSTRRVTVKLIDHFSNGICFEFPPVVARHELRHFLTKHLLNPPDLPSRPWVWTKVGFLVDAAIPYHKELPAESNCLYQKVFTDLIWEMRLEHILEMVDGFDPGTDFWTKYADSSKADANFYRSSNMPYSKVLESEKAFLVRQLMKDDLEAVGRELWDSFLEVRDLSKHQHRAETEYTPWNFPSLQVLAGISAAEMVVSKKFDGHDMLDYRQAALAIPYCSAIFCDNPMAARLRDKPCEFGKVYGTTIHSRPEEIISYLESLIARTALQNNLSGNS